MKTAIYKIKHTAADAAHIRTAGAIIRRGGLVVFPTETVYGLGADALDGAAVAGIYAAKGRPGDNPLIVHICRVGDIGTVAADVPECFHGLAGRFWPGPLTVILKKSPLVPAATTGGLATVAVRMPDHPVALALIAAAGGFVAAPSANLSGRPSPTAVGHVIADMDGRVGMILDGGPTAIGLESTIVDLTDMETGPLIRRPGQVTAAELAAVTGSEVMTAALAGNGRPLAPGTKYRHYSPRGRLVIIAGTEADVIAHINGRVAADREQGRRCGVIAAAPTAGRYRADSVKNIGARGDHGAMAGNLYRILREMDDEITDVIYSETFGLEADGGGLAPAIWNRLMKAADGRMVIL